MSVNLIPPRHTGRQALAAVLGATDALLGATLLASPAHRLSSPGFTAAKAIMPMHAWGAILLALGLWTLAFTYVRRHPGLGIAAAAGWYVFFVATLAISAATTPTVAFTGCITYGAIVVLHLLAAIGQHR